MSRLYVADFEDVKSGFQITFAFASNPYFADAQLTKEFRFTAGGVYTRRPPLT